MRHEINLLPPARRKRLRQRWLQDTALQVLRHIQISLIVLTVIGAIVGGTLKGMLVLTSSNDSSKIQKVMQEYQTIRLDINNGNQLADAVTDVSNQRIVWSDYLAQLLEVLPPSTTIEQIQATRDPAQLQFSGTSINRNSLVILQSRLQSLTWSDKVDAPLQNLLDRENPEYSFTVHIASKATKQQKTTPKTSPQATPQAVTTP